MNRFRILSISAFTVTLLFMGSEITAQNVTAEAAAAAPASSPTPAVAPPKGLNFTPGVPNGVQQVLDRVRRQARGPLDATTLKVTPVALYSLPTEIQSGAPASGRTGITESGGLEGARDEQAIRYIVESGDSVIADLTLNTPDYPSSRGRQFGSDTVNPDMVDSTLARALAHLAALDQIKAGSFEPRLVRLFGPGSVGPGGLTYVGGTYYVLWLKSGTGGPDLIYTLSSTSMRPDGSKLSTAAEFFQALRATNVISGTVVDNNGQPVANASVTFFFLGGRTTQTTDARGAFKLTLSRRLQPDNSLTASRDGLFSPAQPVKLIPDQEIKLTAPLKLSAPFTPPGNAELVVNGGFESPRATEANALTIKPGAEPTDFGWKLSTNTVISGFADIMLQNRGGGNSAAGLQPGGQQWLALNGGIAQTIATVPGGRYALSFAYADRPYQESTATMSVPREALPSVTITDQVSDRQLASVQIPHDASATGNNSWRRAPLILFTAQGSQTTLEFAPPRVSDAGRSGTRRIYLNSFYLDEISVKPYDPQTAGPPGSIAGTVVDTSGKPIPNTDISYTSVWRIQPPSNAPTTYVSRVRATTTDANGLFQLTGLLPGAYRVDAFKTISGSFDLPRNGNVTAVDVKAGAQTALSGPIQIRLSN